MDSADTRMRGLINNQVWKEADFEGSLCHYTVFRRSGTAGPVRHTVKW